MTEKTLSVSFSKEMEDVSFNLTKEKEIELMTRAQNGDIKARNQLVESQLKQITSVARSYADHRNPLSELVSEGVLGFDHAIKKFDLSVGVRFVTYYRAWVRDYINRYVLENRVVRTPLNHSKKSQKTIDKEIAEGKNPVKMADVCSMDKQVKDGDTTTYGDFLPCGDCVETNVNTSLSVRKVLKQLNRTSKEWKILKYHYIDGMTMDEIGDLFGISKQAVSANMNKTIKRLRSRI